MKPVKKSPKQPSESYAARVARGRVPISVELPVAALEALDAMAERRGVTRRQMLVELIAGAVSEGA